MLALKLGDGVMAANLSAVAIAISLLSLPPKVEAARQTSIALGISVG
jgi:hypothetical protein